MDHEELRERLSAYLEADLEASERARVEEHLNACPDCRREYRELRHMVDLLRGLPAPDLPPDLADRVIARLRAGEGRPGLVERCQAWIAGVATVSWSAPVAKVPCTLSQRATSLFSFSAGIVVMTFWFGGRLEDVRQPGALSSSLRTDDYWGAGGGWGASGRRSAFLLRGSSGSVELVSDVCDPGRTGA